MRDCLHPLLLLLTLLDLAFVQATDIVPASGLLPLWLLAIASLGLRRLQRFSAYRTVWNLGVLLVFALLVRHATTTGLLHMLEDGLLLAVLCQVHLLNNVGERQRPDLIFFNSFLVAFVTSFFAPDLSWSLLFVLHALVLVPSLQVHAMSRRGGDLDRGTVVRLLRDSLPRSAAIGLATVAVFVLWPRDFKRQGWIGDAISLRGRIEGGLAEQIRLDREHGSQLSDAVVLQIQPASGRAEDVPSHWRGIAFSRFDGSSWLPQDAGQLGSRFATDLPWESEADGSWVRQLPAGGAVLHVRLHDLGSRRLPSPLLAAGLSLASGPGILLDPKSYGVLAFLRLEDAPVEPIEYSVKLGTAPRPHPRAVRTREHMLALPDDGVPRIVRDLARQLRAQLPAHADEAEVARATADWLQQHRRYQLPGGPGFARNLGEFVLGTGAGHCEYFATALALLLRLQGVPCRLAGGYLAHEWDAETGTMVVRARDAHAWCEALRPDGTWSTLDATPPADVVGNRAEAGTWWDGVCKDLEAVWNSVVGFDRNQRARWIEGLLGLPASLWSALRAQPLAAAGLLAAAWVLVFLRRRWRQGVPAIVALHRAARAAGLDLRAGETPRELLARAAATVEPALLEALQAAAREHESSRYAVAAGAPGAATITGRRARSPRRPPRPRRAPAHVR